MLWPIRESVYVQNVQTFVDAGRAGAHHDARPQVDTGKAATLSVAFDLQFGLHPANIDTWTFAPVVASVCRFARTGDLRPIESIRKSRFPESPRHSHS